MAPHLANGDMPSVVWSVAPGNKVSLDYLTEEKSGERFYWLTDVKDVDRPEMEGRQYVFDPTTGELLAVYSLELDIDDERGLGRSVMSMDFQLAAGLTAPLEEDERKLDKLLASGLDNPTLEER